MQFLCVCLPYYSANVAEVRLILTSKGDLSWIKTEATEGNIAPIKATTKVGISLIEKTTVANILSTALSKTQSEEEGLSRDLAISGGLKKIMSTN